MRDISVPHTRTEVAKERYLEHETRNVERNGEPYKQHGVNSTNPPSEASQSRAS
jgi:hypothetical protein